jgi:hypothetical protein
LQLTKLRTLL